MIASNTSTTQPQSSLVGLELQELVKRYGEVTVVQQLSLQVRAGEFLVLLGESGCGKSTTLRMIAGLESATEGRILIGGRDVTELAPKQRNIAMVFQNYALYPHMNVAENMSFALTLSGSAKAEVDRRVQEAARILNIEHLLKRKPKELSGGQRQRVAIGRSIVREPDVFLFDEPLSNLDAKLRGHMRAELALLHERLGKTTVYVTHDQVEAMTLASRIVILHKGVIQQVGSPHEVFNHPANLFVAGFIGSPTMNLLPGHIDTEGRVYVSGVALPITVGQRMGAHARCIVGVRPQALREDTANAATAALRMQVKVVEYLGTDSVLIGCLEHEPQTRITAVFPGHRHDLAHRSVALALDSKQVLLFDAASELALPVRP